MLFKVLHGSRVNSLTCHRGKLCLFVSYLAKEKLKHRSIRTYMSAVCHLQIGAGFPDPFGQSLHIPRLEYVMKGIKRVQAEEGSTIKERLPITPHILRRLREVWAPREISGTPK